MSVKINAQLLETLGQTQWQLRSDFNLLSQGTTAESTQIEALSLEEQSPRAGQVDQNLNSQVTAVLVGEGLDRLWQQEDQPEWQLLSNIFKSVSLDIERVEYFDSSNLHSQQAIMSVLEDVIDSGVEQVFSFDLDGELIEQLSEGLNVVLLPRLEDQLVSGQAKKVCFQQLINHVQI